MIRAVLTRVENGALHSCSVHGHSGFAAAGKDIVCAAVSVLLRTALSVLTEKTGIAVKTDIPERGMLSFRIETGSVSVLNAGILTYTADFLETGLSALQNEYPVNISVRVLHTDENDL